MFGNMFDDSAMTTTEPQSKCNPMTLDGNTIEQPPNERNGKPLIGIKNQGATCYLNSLLQTLFFTPEFREQLFCISPEELGKLNGRDKDLNVKVRKIPLQLQLLLARLLLLDQDSCTTQDLTESFGWENDEQFQQHDVQELSRLLFDAIENSLVGTSGDKLIHSLFKGNIVNQTRCCTCDRVSEREEEFLDITVSVAGENSLEKALSAMFQSEELMCGKNQYRCEQCNKLVDARKGAQLGSVPPILTVSLLRFNFDPKTLSRYKATCHFSFPVKLDIAGYCKDPPAAQTDSEGGKQCTEYLLYSVVIHKGSAHRGHYHAYIRDVDGLGHSDIPVSDADYEPDFSKVTANSTTARTVQRQSSAHNGDSGESELGPEEILACLVAQHSGTVKVSDLGKMLQHETGISWSKKYRKRHGTMLKFVKSCTETFEFDAKNETVSLKDTAAAHLANAPSPSRPKTTNNFTFKTELDEVTSCEEKHLSNGSVNEEPDSCAPACDDASTMQKPREESCHDSAGVDLSEDSHRLGASWFNVNDETIKPISVHTIPDQFAGQQSAYMLFYRRKDLARPGASWDNMTYNVPRHIRDSIETENEQLTKWRKEYDLALNRLDLRIFTEAMCRSSGQLIMSQDNGGYLLHIDRRQTVHDLLSIVFESLAKMTKRKKKQKLAVSRSREDRKVSQPRHSHLHTVKILEHGGLHLYDCVSENKDILLTDAGLRTEMHLFLWDGQSIFGRPITCGEEAEPVAVTLYCTFSDTLWSKLRFAATKSSCFDVVASYATELLRLPAEELEFERSVVIEAEDGEKVSDYVIFPDDSDQPCGYQEFFNVLKKSSLQESDERDQPIQNGEREPPIQVKVKNCAVKYDEQLSVLSDVIYTFDVPSTMIVGELKHLICTSLDLNDDGLRLSYSHHDDCYPLHVDSELQSFDLSEDCLFILEKGAEPSSSEIVVYVKMKRDKYFLEMIMPLSTKMPKFLSNVQKKFELSDNEWHLSRCNSYGELSGDLDYSGDDIIKCGIHDRQCIAICPGKAVEKGMISIKLWLYQPQPSLVKKCSDSNILSFLAEKERSCVATENGQSLSELKHWKSIDNLDSLEPTYLGHDSVKKEGTLYELKTSIESAIPSKYKQSGKHLRIRVIEKSALTRVVHFNDGGASIKRLKIPPLTNLSVQWMDAEQSNKEVVVSIQFHLPGTRSYTEPLELVCEANPSSLPALVADTIDMPVEDLMFARKVNEKASWSRIRPESSQTTASKSKAGKKGKGGGKRKPSSRASKEGVTPLKDADVIGVKIISEENKVDKNPITLTDFDSEDDLLQRQKIEERERAADSARRSTTPDKQLSSAGDTRKVTKKGEATLRIHVDNFAQNDEDRTGTNASD